MTTKPILCLDFDGVIHSYTSPWKGPENVTDPPTEGAMEFIHHAQHYFNIAIYSARSNSPDGLWAMKVWLARHMREWREWFGAGPTAEDTLSAIIWPNQKPHAHLYIDDRAMLFTGTFPDPQSLLSFKPWNRK